MEALMVIAVALGVSKAIGTYKKYITEKEDKMWEKLNAELVGHSLTGTVRGQTQRTSETPVIQYICASLVCGASYRVKVPSAIESEYSKWWTYLHYERIPVDKVLIRACDNYDMELMQKDIEKENQRKYICVFHRNMNQYPSAVAPEWVVAIRGTEPRLPQDLWTDARILCGTLHRSSLSRLLEAVVYRLIKDHGLNKVCVTGYSLGASAGMFVARKLVLKGHPVECHLFNPPFASWSIFTTLVERVLKSSVFRHVRSAVTSANSEISRTTGTVNMELHELRVLARWAPHLYVNENDLISKEYITHFEPGPEGSNNFTRCSLCSLRDSQTFHLLPRAVLHKSKKYTKRLLSAHMLFNWLDKEIVPVVTARELDVEQMIRQQA